MALHGLLRRRDLLVPIGSGLAALGLASACTARSAVPSLAPGQAQTVAPPQVKSSGPLILAQTAAIPSTDPFPSGPALSAFRWAMFNPLVSLDAKKQPLPYLAESWAFSGDGRTLTFHLRRGVKFHSGRPLTAEAVK